MTKAVLVSLSFPLGLVRTCSLFIHFTADVMSLCCHIVVICRTNMTIVVLDIPIVRDIGPSLQELTQLAPRMYIQPAPRVIIERETQDITGTIVRAPPGCTRHHALRGCGATRETSTHG